ncbi:hypothetical protein HNY73_013590 [Argiope bruennichi]|uniref:Uncharacterized protein n=1 Tax=Argiope bruennichi TaxID=94029 RepID=A0A8T0F3D6_ARGBR|nr:hypothetical protein HNY73_013590 [Argiope bruennichi]
METAPIQTSQGSWTITATILLTAIRFNLQLASKLTFPMEATLTNITATMFTNAQKLTKAARTIVDLMAIHIPALFQAKESIVPAAKYRMTTNCTTITHIK